MNRWTAWLLHMWQSCVETEDYSIAYFDRIAAFKALYHWTSVKGSSYALCRLFSYSRIYEAHMSPALNRSSAIQCFQHSDSIEISDGIIFDLYTGLPRMVVYCTCSLEAYLYPDQEMGLDIQPGSVMRSTIEAIKTVHKVYVGMQVRSYFCSLKPPSLWKNIAQILHKEQWPKFKPLSFLLSILLLGPVQQVPVTGAPWSPQQPLVWRREYGGNARDHY